MTEKEILSHDILVEDINSNIFLLDNNELIKIKNVNSKILETQGYSKIVLNKKKLVKLSLPLEDLRSGLNVAKSIKIYYKNILQIEEGYDFLIITGEKSQINISDDYFCGDNSDLISNKPSNFLHVCERHIVNINTIENIKIKYDTAFLMISFNFKNYKENKKYIITEINALKFKNYHINKNKENLIEACHE